MPALSEAGLQLGYYVGEPVYIYFVLKQELFIKAACSVVIRASRTHVQHGVDVGHSRRRGRLAGRDDALFHRAHLLPGDGPAAR